MTVFNALSSFFWTPSVEDDPRIQVLQNTEYGGVTSTPCLLETDAAGNYYLKPEKGPETIVQEKFPYSEEWPASAKQEKEYQERIRAFPGLNEKRDPSCIAELLNDVALNIPHQSLIVRDSQERKYTILGQVANDICRNNALYVNDQLVFSSPSVFLNKSDDENAKEVFEKCMRLLNNDVNLSNNALKLATQATVAHLCGQMHFRFTNPALYWQMFCVNQVIKINSLSSPLTTINYTTLWKLQQLGEQFSSPEKFSKADVNIIIDTKSLQSGSVGGGCLYERISPFFKGEEEALGFDLNKASYRSTLKSRKEYLGSIRGETREVLPAILVKALIQKNRSPTASPVNLYSDFRKLRALKINGVDLLSKVETNLSIERRAALLIEEIEHHCQQKEGFSSTLIAISFLGLFEKMWATYRERYENMDLSYLLQNKERSLDVTIENKNINLSINSIWTINDMLLAEPLSICQLNGTINMTCPLDAIMTGDDFFVTAMQHTIAS